MIYLFSFFLFLLVHSTVPLPIHFFLSGLTHILLLFFFSTSTFLFYLLPSIAFDYIRFLISDSITFALNYHSLASITHSYIFPRATTFSSNSNMQSHSITFFSHYHILLPPSHHNIFPLSHYLTFTLHYHIFSLSQAPPTIIFYHYIFLSLYLSRFFSQLHCTLL